MDGLYGNKATQEEKTSKGIRELLGKTVQKRLMPPDWTASLLLLHVADELFMIFAIYEGNVKYYLICFDKYPT